MDDCEDDEHEDIIRNYLIKEGDTEIHDEVRKISIETKNEDLIHRYMTKMKERQNWIPIKS